MRECCDVRPVASRHARVLRRVLAINAGMFVVELAGALAARSTSLLADSADMLGDVIVYAFSLYVIGRGPVWEARAARLKAGVMALFGLGVLGEVVVKVLHGVTPHGGLMSGVGVVALAANATVLAALWPHRADDLNMRSVWLCSRNDVIANVAVLVAAVGVTISGAAWPDIVVGLAIALLFGASAVAVLRATIRHDHGWRTARWSAPSRPGDAGGAARGGP
jgi:Co/Zn/Cd efflux system component